MDEMASDVAVLPTQLLQLISRHRSFVSSGGATYRHPKTLQTFHGSHGMRPEKQEAKHPA